MTLSARYAEAVAYAAEAHAGQVRKGTSIPYISHPLAVSALVLEHGGDEDQAIAALLHDVLEDCGEHHGPVIEDRFGSQVHGMVRACTDGVVGPDGSKPDWLARKKAYLTHLGAVPLDTLLVTLCDKLHNASAIQRDRETIGDAVFNRFSAGRQGTEWYYTSLCCAFSDRLGPEHAGVARLSAVVEATYA